jgi:hypothetical protein
VTDLRIPSASAMQASIFSIRICASRWHQRCRWMNGDFGRFPFRGQLSGRPLPASTLASHGAETKAQGAARAYFAAEMTSVGARSRRRAQIPAMAGELAVVCEIAIAPRIVVRIVVAFAPAPLRWTTTLISRNSPLAIVL